MKTLYRLGLAVVMATTLGCGSDDGKDEGSSNSFLPTIDFDLPDAASGTSLALTTETRTLLERWAARFDRVVTDINRVMTRLNSDAISAAGSFSGKGPDGNISGVVSELSGDADYTHSATVCVSNNVFQHFLWNEDGSRVEVYRDLSQRPVNIDTVGTADMMVHLVYAAGATTTINFKASGQPWDVPTTITDDDASLDSLTENILGTKNADGSIDFIGVNEWWTAGNAPTTYTGDGWLTGKINANGSGQFVGFRSFNDEALLGGCTNFDEDNTDAPGWCLGRTIGGTHFDDTERAAAWEELKPLGIANTENLEMVTFPENLSCE